MSLPQFPCQVHLCQGGTCCILCWGRRSNCTFVPLIRGKPPVPLWDFLVLCQLLYWLKTVENKGEGKGEWSGNKIPLHVSASDLAPFSPSSHSATPHSSLPSSITVTTNHHLQLTCGWWPCQQPACVATIDCTGGFLAVSGTLVSMCYAMHAWSRHFHLDLDTSASRTCFASGQIEKGVGYNIAKLFSSITLQQKQATVPGNTNYAVLRNLQPDTRYKVTVIPEYPEGDGGRMSDAGKTCK